MFKIIDLIFLQLLIGSEKIRRHLFNNYVRQLCSKSIDDTITDR